MPTRVLLRAALVAACLAGATASAIVYTSQVRLGDAFIRFGAGQDFPGALRALRASDSPLNPNVARDSGIAVSLLHTGHPAEGERLMAALARRQPENIRAWVTLARIQVARKRLAAARASYAQARRLGPNIPPQLPPPF